MFCKPFCPYSVYFLPFGNLDMWDRPVKSSKIPFSHPYPLTYTHAQGPRQGRRRRDSLVLHLSSHICGRRRRPKATAAQVPVAIVEQVGENEEAVKARGGRPSRRRGCRRWGEAWCCFVPCALVPATCVRLGRFPIYISLGSVVFGFLHIVVVPIW